ncbi:MAG TPA: lamin tail domain-containing protein, partial [Thermoplasmatales archaeon]|nr:lamin tail domain-containing protein [Thermoplasmatales archaeon]
MRLLKKVMAAASLLLLMIALSTLLTSRFSTADETVKVVLNEIIYNPHGDEPENEWIELYNMEEYPVNLTGWYITDDPDFISPGREGSYCFPSNTIIDDGECLIVAYNGKSFLNEYGFYPDYEMENSTPVVSDMIQLNKGFNLANSGDDMHLFDMHGIEVDKVWYG